MTYQVIVFYPDGATYERLCEDKEEMLEYIAYLYGLPYLIYKEIRIVSL